MKKGNLAASALFAALAIFVIRESSFLPGGRAGVPGPAVFPTAVAVLLLMASLSLTISSFRMPPEEDRSLELLKPDCRRVYLCMAVMVAYVVILPLVGFCVTS
ncbi:MAG: tripartite tricarboxylate transporter TctB family protein, partial [Planctomycetota bacterium]|nr:tripartite tricarboxylate transporter TctB family protein [Planctomycetota bacterium]